MTLRSEAVTGTVSEKPLSQKVVYALADATGQDPTELEPIHDVVDLDALDRLFRTGAGFPSGRVVFQTNGCEVTVHASGTVDVETR